MKEDLLDQAKLLILSQNYRKAKEILEKLYKNNPSDTEIMYHLALVKEILYEREEAIILYKKILEVIPDHKEAKERLQKIMEE
ncbi:MAG: tetratricopeptide repeat protein [Candidatus Hydrothermales bacterium]